MSNEPEPAPRPPIRLDLGGITLYEESSGIMSASPLSFDADGRMMKTQPALQITLPGPSAKLPPDVYLHILQENEMTAKPAILCMRETGQIDTSTLISLLMVTKSIEFPSETILQGIPLENIGKRLAELRRNTFSDEAVRVLLYYFTKILEERGTPPNVATDDDETHIFFEP